jgi:hypothetical protein
MKKISGVLVAAVLGAFLMAGTALATSLDFGIVEQETGHISYAGGSAPLVGTNISVNNVKLSDGTHVHNVIGGMLNFTTGDLLFTWLWGGGPNSWITVVGGVDTNNDNAINPADGDIALGTTLLSGSFGTASIYYADQEFHMAAGSFSDGKDENLLRHFGLAGLPVGTKYSGNFKISFSAPLSIGSPFMSLLVAGGNVSNTIPTTSDGPTDTNGPTTVPEPSIMLLLGLALMGLAGIRRKLKE